MLHLRFDCDNGNDERGVLFKLSIVPIHIAYNAAHSTHMYDNSNSLSFILIQTHTRFTKTIVRFSSPAQFSHIHTMVKICMYNVILIVILA